MKLATFQAGDTIEAFVRRTYPHASEADRRRLEAAVLKTNPQLRRPDAEAGASIVVLPDVPGEETDMPGAATIAHGLVQAIRNVTPELRDLLRLRIERQHERMNARLSELKQSEVRGIKDADAKSQLSAIAYAIRDQQNALRERQHAADDAIGALEADLDALLGGGRGSQPEVPDTAPRRPARRARKRKG